MVVWYGDDDSKNSGGVIPETKVFPKSSGKVLSFDLPKIGVGLPGVLSTVNRKVTIRQILAQYS